MEVNGAMFSTRKGPEVRMTLYRREALEAFLREALEVDLGPTATIGEFQFTRLVALAVIGMSIPHAAQVLDIKVETVRRLASGEAMMGPHIRIHIVGRLKMAAVDLW